MSHHPILERDRKIAQRRRRAHLVLTAYAAACEATTPNSDRMEHAPNSPEAYLIDLLADLMHWCDTQNFDFVDCFQQAEDHHDLEIDPTEPCHDCVDD